MTNVNNDKVNSIMRTHTRKEYPKDVYAGAYHGPLGLVSTDGCRLLFVPFSSVDNVGRTYSCATKQEHRIEIKGKFPDYKRMIASYNADDYFYVHVLNIAKESKKLRELKKSNSSYFSSFRLPERVTLNPEYILKAISVLKKVNRPCTELNVYYKEGALHPCFISLGSFTDIQTYKCAFVMVMPIRA